MDKIKASWALYDFGNSAFSTLVVTFIYATYFTQAIATDEISGTVQWSRAVAVCSVFIALCAPLLGAVADRGYRRHCLLISTLICCVATAVLTFVSPDMEHAVWLALTLFIIANIASELGMVFYNAYLPIIAPLERIGKISGWAWGIGYIGGLMCLLLALIVLVREQPLFGISTEAGFHYRLTNLLAAAWFLLFSIPLLVFAPAQSAATDTRISISTVYRDLIQTLRDIRRYSEIVKLLGARLIYNDGLITVFSFGGIYAAGTFGMDLSQVIQFGIAINVAAGIGVCLFGYVDDRIGGKQTVMLTLVGLFVCTLMAVWAPTAAWLWVAGIGIGIFVGPNQSASRTLMARFVPPQHSTQFFGFFAFSGKITAFIGPLLLGIVTQITQSQRAGVATLAIFFIVGAVLLRMVDEKRGIAATNAA